MKVIKNEVYLILLINRFCIIFDKITLETKVKIEKDNEILCGCVSSNNNEILLVTSDKNISLHNIADGSFIKNVTCSKKPNAICMITHEKKEYAVIADKNGYLIGMPFPELTPMKFLFGHTASIITCIMSKNGYLVSSDRDEKIFVNQFPQSYIIHSLCSGHTMYIKCLCDTPRDNVILSGGGDGTVFMWNIDNGRIIHAITLDDTESLETVKTKEHNRKHEPKEEELIYEHPIIQEICTCQNQFIITYCNMGKKLFIINMDTFEYIDSYEFPAIIAHVYPVYDTKNETEKTSLFYVFTQDNHIYKLYLENTNEFKIHSDIFNDAETIFKELIPLGYTIEDSICLDTEMMKRIVHDRVEQSAGYEKQLEHINKKVKKDE
ncbi:hypothetical protein WA158_004304 [Blastocystis sp. Blastoise]